MGRSKEQLLIIAERACAALCSIANHLTTDEGDEDDTEEEFGLSCAEVVEMAHDNMIHQARFTLDSIAKSEHLRAKPISPPEREGAEEEGKHLGKEGSS